MPGSLSRLRGRKGDVVAIGVKLKFKEFVGDEVDVVHADCKSCTRYRQRALGDIVDFLTADEDRIEGIIGFEKRYLDAGWNIEAYLAFEVKQLGIWDFVDVFFDVEGIAGGLALVIFNQDSPSPEY